MSAVNFQVNDRIEVDLITGIAERAVSLAKRNGIKYDQQTAHMDITATHCNGCPLRLADLLNADDGNFGHDVFGIMNHINRNTGKLENYFTPRFAAPR